MCPMCSVAAALSREPFVDLVPEGRGISMSTRRRGEQIVPVESHDLQMDQRTWAPRCQQLFQALSQPQRERSPPCTSRD